MAVDLEALFSDLKTDLGIEADDNRKDAEIQRNLDASLDYVRRVRADLDWTAGSESESESDSELPDPTADNLLGVVRLAARWFDRKKSLDGVVELGDMGSARIPAYDSDIEKLLGIGLFADPVIA